MKQNIVFFFSDQQRFDTLGCNGQPLDITPNLDAFAQEGVNFANAFTPQPVCGPARACLQTGLYPTQLGCFKNAVSLPLEVPTIAKAMREAGYRVAYVGKWHLASDENDNHYETSPVPMERRGGYDDYWMVSDVLEFTSHGYGGHVFDKDGNKVSFDGYRVDCLTDLVLDYINNYEDDKPFFLFVSHIEPHHQNDRHDYEGPQGSKEKYKDFTPPADMIPGKGDWDKFYPDYLGCCHSLDENFGRVVSALKEKGIYDDTLVVYASDHGCHFKVHADEVEPGGADDYKRNSFEGTIHVPLLMRGPGFRGGRKEEKLVSLIDLPITLMTAAGCNIDPAVQGRPLQEIDSPDWDNCVYIQISESFVGRAIRTDRYKYVVHAEGKHPYEVPGSEVYTDKHLYDLKDDPWEEHDRKDDPSYAQIKEELRKRLVRCARQAGEGDIRIEDE